GRFDAHQDVEDARLPVQRQQVGVADDVGGADGGEEAYGQPAGRQLLQEAPPDVAQGGGVLVGQGDEADAVAAVQPGDLVGQPGRVAVPPAHPEAVLAAVGAAVRAAARQLHDGRSAQPEAAV